MRIDIIIKVLMALIGLIKVIVDVISEIKTEGGESSSNKQYRICERVLRIQVVILHCKTIKYIKI